MAASRSSSAVRRAAGVAVAKLHQWSFSRWDCYEKCPAQAKYKFIDKIPTARGPALIRGGEIDEAATAYVESKVKKLPIELRLFADEFADLRKRKATSQQMWALDASWTPLDDNFAPNVWVRIKTDFWHFVDKSKRVLKIIDLKTGKRREGYEQQLELYGVGGLAQFPAVERVETEMWYSDQGEIVGNDPETGVGIYERKDMLDLQHRWHKRTRAMLSDTKFAPKPGFACRFCDFSKAKGGPCQY